MAISELLQRFVPRRVTPLVVLNIFFAFLAVVGQVGQNVSLPLWDDSTQVDCGLTVHGNSSSNNGSNGTVSAEQMDPYFVLSFASLSFVIVFGTITLVLVLLKLILDRLKIELRVDSLIVSKKDLKFPQWQFVLIGLFDALNGVLVVSASIPSRTAPFLQAILGNFLIPLTIVFR